MKNKDEELYKLAIRVFKKNQAYLNELKKLEEKYIEMRGAYPSEIDDDWFIDTFHYNSSSLPTRSEFLKKFKGEILPKRRSK